VARARQVRVSIVVSVGSVKDGVPVAGALRGKPVHISVNQGGR